MVMKAIFHPIQTRTWMRILWISPDSQNMLKWLRFFFALVHKIPKPLRYPAKMQQLKVPFFIKWDLFFQISQSPKKNLKTILSLKFEIPAYNSKQLTYSNFKLRIVFRKFFWEIGRFEKRTSLSEKKPHLKVA